MLNATPEFLAALKQRRIRLALLCELEYELNAVRFWTRRGTLEWQGVTWKGLAGPVGATSALLSITSIDDNSEGRAGGVSFTLSGAPLVAGDGSSILQLVKDGARLGGRATIWLALFNLTTGALIADPKRKFTGQLDVPVIEFDVATFTVTQSAESHLARLEGNSGLRYDDETQRRFFPGDRGFEFTARSQKQVDSFGP